MSDEQKTELTLIEKWVKFTGLFLITVMLLSHAFYKEIDLYVLLIPALMIGLDIKSFITKK